MLCPKYSIEIFLVLNFGFALNSISAECTRFKWECDSGQCINYEDLCDGREDCMDGSDEIFEHCIHLPCPSYAYHCAYGACVADNVLCNDHKDCADGSDEMKLLCDPNLQNDTAIRNYLRGDCKSEFSLQCEPGECIEIEKKCDGKKDCENGVDESVEVCSNNYCQPYAFRCAYGGCVSGTARCDGKRDCADGSDETPELCKPISEPEFCDLPMKQEVLKFEQINVNKNDNKNMDQKRISFGSILKFSCKQDWKLVGAKYSMCRVDGWSKPFPHCTKYCPNSFIQRPLSTKATCTHNEKHISCNALLPIGTVAHFSCRPGYIFNEKEITPLSDGIRCNSNGEWFTGKRKCTPKCGTVDPKQGEEMPWDVSIYRWDGLHFKHQCYGTIVSPKIVISAEKCFNSIQSPDSDDHEWYNIVAGNYDEDYKATEIHRPVYNVSEIFLTTSLKTLDNIAIIILVNYFEFSDLLLPVCIQLKGFTTSPYAKIETFSNKTRMSDNFGASLTQIYGNSGKEIHFMTAIVKKTTGAKPITINDFGSFIKKHIERYNYLL